MATNQELWLKRKDVMSHEDDMNELKQDVDEVTLRLLQEDDIINDLIADHNKLCDAFEIEVAEATKHLEEKLNKIQKEKAEISQYKDYILGNNKELTDIVLNYTEAKDNWKRSITKYTMKLDEYVNSGEVKDV